MKHLRTLFRFEAGRTEFSALEWFVMRLLFAASLFSSFRLAGYNALDWAGSPGRSGWQVTQPRGIAQFVDVNWIVDPAYIPWLAAGVCLGLVLLVSGVFPLVAAGVLLFIKTHIGTLENSASANVFHTSQILCFGLIGILLGCLYNHYHAWRVGRWRQHVLGGLPPEARSRVIYTVQQLLAAAYMVAGISKLWRSKGEWVSQSANIHLQFVKNQKQTYYETLEVLPASNWAVDFVMQYPTAAKLALGSGLVLELCCFFALWNRSLSLLWGSSLILMHQMISLIMDLNFDFNIHLVFIFFVNLTYWISKPFAKA